MIKNFRSHEYAVEFYHHIQTLGLRGSLRDQLERASQSVALNLAEGSEKSSIRDKRRFYEIAFCSARECQSALRLLRLENTAAWEVLDKVTAAIYCLMKSTKEIQG